MRRTRIHDVIWGLKDVPCRDCGLRFPPWVMTFDHHRGDKLFNVSSGSVSIEAMLVEAAKCDVVCSCCHAVRTYNRYHARP